MFIASAFALYKFDVAWWFYLLLFLGPDIGMIGYAINPKIGAITYNLFHHKGIATAVGLIGFAIGNIPMLLVGIILFGHSSMDRIFGYGLKFSDDFKNTHLGRL